MTQLTGTKAQPIFYLYTVLNLHVLIYCTGPQFFTWTSQIVDILDAGDSDVDFQSIEEDNNDDDDEVAAGPSSEDLSAGYESEAEPGQH